jgi:hypothetical protein
MAGQNLQGALPAPDGVEPDFDLSHNPLRVTYITSLVLMLVFPAITVPMRMFTKVFIMKAFKIADILCLIAFLNFVALIAFGFIFVENGMGKHAWEITPQSFAKVAELLNIQQAVYMPAILFTKVTVLLQLLDIFVPRQTSNASRWYSLWTLIGLNTVFFTTLMFLEIFQCRPREKIWNPMIAGTCININQTFVATGVINVIDDWVILILPLVWTWKLRLRTKQKIGVSLIFATGFFACVTSVMRLVESIRSLDNHDITVSLVPVSLWAVAEVSSGLVVCCLPLIPRLFGRRNARTRLEVSEPSEYAGLNSKGDSQSHNVGYDPSLHSNASQIGRQVQGESIIMKSVRVDQTSDPF